MPGPVLSVTDSRTGRQYELSIEDGTIRAADLRQIKDSEEDFGLMAYDPGFTNTACCRSEITYIDGERGILSHRGYPIEQLAESCDFMSVSYLLLHGELPDTKEHGNWVSQIRQHLDVPENIRSLIDSFPQDSFSMGMVMSSVAALSSYYPEALDVKDEASRRLQIYRLMGKIPTIAAYVYRRKVGQSYVAPNKELSYAGNFLNMMFADDASYVVNSSIEKVMDVLFVLHADHEQNCSANAMRSVGTSRADPYTAAAAAVGALGGPLHGGANEAVLRMLEKIGSKDRVAAHVKLVKEGETRLMGFGHRVYKNYDPRARIIKRLASQVFEVTGSNPLLDVALELERIALEDEYFVKRKLYPNVDFYSGLIYQAIGFPTDMFPVLFAIGRTVGWASQWDESLRDPERKIARPRQIYDGFSRREVPAQKSSDVSE